MEKMNYGVLTFSYDDLEGKDLYGLYELVAAWVGFDPHDPLYTIKPRFLKVSEELFELVRQTHLEQGNTAEQFGTIWLLEGPIVHFLYKGLVVRVEPGYVERDESALDIDPEDAA